MNIAFIGGGNMASSLIGGLITDGYAADKITVVDTDLSKLQLLHQKFNVHTHTDLEVVVQNAQIVVFAVKPQTIKAVAQQLSPTLTANKALVISVAAGIRTVDIENWIGMGTAVVRAMPNTPALVQCGASGMFANTNVSGEQKQRAESILRATGLVIWVDQEEQMNTVTALSGSGPAYFFRIMEVLQIAATQAGLPSETARLLTLQTALGAAKMALESEDSVSTLREKVTSPGGTTEQGLRVMDENQIAQLFNQVIQAAQQRAQELAQELGDS